MEKNSRLDSIIKELIDINITNKNISSSSEIIGWTYENEALDAYNIREFIQEKGVSWLDIDYVIYSLVKEFSLSQKIDVLIGRYDMVSSYSSVSDKVLQEVINNLDENCEISKERIRRIYINLSYGNKELLYSFLNFVDKNLKSKSLDYNIETYFKLLVASDRFGNEGDKEIKTRLIKTLYTLIKNLECNFDYNLVDKISKISFYCKDLDVEKELNFFTSIITLNELLD